MTDICLRAGLRAIRLGGKGTERLLAREGRVGRNDCRFDGERDRKAGSEKVGLDGGDMGEGERARCGVGGVGADRSKSEVGGSEMESWAGGGDLKLGFS